MTVGPNTNNQWLSGRGWESGGIVVVVCPRKYRTAIQKVGVDELKTWAKDDYPNGAIVVRKLLWILWPDPGCEL